MNIQTILSEWRRMEGAWASFMFDEKKVDTAIQFNSDDPKLLKSLIKDDLKSIYKSIDDCIDALEKIRGEL